MKRVAFLALAVVAVAAAAAAQQAPQVDEATANRYLELVRTDIAQQRVDLISTAMRFEPAESAAFWPIYTDFENELNAIGDARVALIRDFAANFETMTDAKARELGEQSLALEGQRFELRQRYFERIADEISPVIASRFLQVDRQLQMLLDLQIASEIPLIQR